MIFESGDDSYTILLPDADVDTAVRLLEDLRKKLAARPIQGRARTLSIGVSSRGGRLIDERVLCEEADVALSKASREGGDQVIGFRADAVRFRETLTGSMT
jgi:GGDEF domain-containing protein